MREAGGCGRLEGSHIPRPTTKWVWELDQVEGGRERGWGYGSRCCRKEGGRWGRGGAELQKVAAPAVFFLAVFYVLSKIALELFVRPKNGRKLEGKYQTQKVFVLFSHLMIMLHFHFLFLASSTPAPAWIYFGISFFAKLRRSWWRWGWLVRWGRVQRRGGRRPLPSRETQSAQGSAGSSRWFSGCSVFRTEEVKWQEFGS